MKTALIGLVLATLAVSPRKVVRAPARAYIDAAKRLKGENISMIVPSMKKGLLDKLFARRAA